MSGLNRQPFLPILLFTLFCGVLLFLVIQLMGLQWHSVNVFSLIFYGGLTMLIHFWQERSFKTDPKGFVTRFMLGLILKMFLSLAVVVAMLLLIKGEHRIFSVLVFGFLYLAFLTFSTVRLVNLSKKG